MEKELKEAIAHLEWLLKDGILASEDEPHIKMVLNRLEQDERVIKEMAECFFRYKSHFTTLDEYNNENQIIDHFRKKCE